MSPFYDKKFCLAYLGLMFCIYTMYIYVAFSFIADFIITFFFLNWLIAFQSILLVVPRHQSECTLYSEVMPTKCSRRTPRVLQMWLNLATLRLLMPWKALIALRRWVLTTVSNSYLQGWGPGECGNEGRLSCLTGKLKTETILFQWIGLLSQCL